MRDPGDRGSQREQTNGRRTGAVDQLDLLQIAGTKLENQQSRTHAVGADLDGLANVAQTQIAEAVKPFGSSALKSPASIPEICLAGPTDWRSHDILLRKQRRSADPSDGIDQRKELSWLVGGSRPKFGTLDRPALARRRVGRTDERSTASGTRERSVLCPIGAGSGAWAFDTD